MQPFPSPAELIPHRAAMVLLDRVTAHTHDTTSCEVELKRAAFLHNGDDTIAATCLIELLSQTAATHAGLTRLHSGANLAPPTAAFLVSIRNLELHRGELREKQSLTLTATCIGQAGGLSSFECSAVDTVSGLQIASGKLQFFTPTREVPTEIF